MKYYVIYKIYWPGKGFYFGKTKGYGKRRNRHLRELKDGTHHNKNLLLLYLKYGTPKIKIIQLCQDEDHMAEAEKIMLSKYSEHKKCCNIQHK